MKNIVPGIISGILILGTAVTMYLFFNQDKKKDKEDTKPASEPRGNVEMTESTDEFTGAENAKVIIDKSGLRKQLARNKKN